jgi:hypothetical protein
MGMEQYIRAIAGALLLLAVACSPKAAERLRQHTYPPDFHYIPKERIDSTMWQLAQGVSELDRLMREADPGDPQLQLRVVQALANMQEATRALGPGDWPSNHPRVSANVEAFRKDLAAARAAAAATPPSYYLAGSISGACLHCH